MSELPVAGRARSGLPRPWIVIALLLAAGALLPLASVRYVPSLDGPWHAFNARVLADLALDRDSAWRTFYAVDPSPRPYWGALVVLAALGELFEPQTSLRLFFIVLAVALPAALAALRCRIHGSLDGVALLAFPFAYGLLHHLGLLGLCLGSPLLVVALAYWWPRRRAPGARVAVVLGALLLLLWFCHLFVWVVGVGALLGGTFLLAALGRASWRAWRSLALAALPGFALAGWYFTSVAGDDAAGGQVPAALTDLLLLGAPFAGLAAAERFPAALVALTVLALAATTILQGIRRRQLTDGELVFGAGAAAALALTILAPRTVAGGTLLEPRLATYFFIFLFLAVAEPADRRARAIAPAVALAFAVAHPLALLPVYDQFDRQARAIVDTLAIAARGERVKFVRFDTARDVSTPLLPTSPIASVPAWSAAANRWIPLDNQFPGRSFSPIRFHDGAGSFRLPRAQGDSPADFVAALEGGGEMPFDLLVVWRLPAAFQSAPELRDALRPRGGVGLASAFEPIRSAPVTER